MLGINSNQLIIDHQDTGQQDKNTFFLITYHWRRKLRYWKCSVSNKLDDDKK